MSEQITDWLDEVQQRADAATKGPWIWDGREIDQSWTAEEQLLTVVSSEVECSTFCYGGTAEGVIENADGVFIAAARTDLPAAVSALRAVLAECDYLERVQATHRVEVGQREVIRRVRAAIRDALGVEVTE